VCVYSIGMEFKEITRQSNVPTCSPRLAEASGFYSDPVTGRVNCRKGLVGYKSEAAIHLPGGSKAWSRW
jgi:hypothetical protein